MESFVRDLKFASRMLLKRPGFTALCVVCLALGIGASAAIFSVVNGVLLQPLPYPHADRLLAVGSSRDKEGKINAMSAPDFYDMRETAKLSEVAVWNDEPYSFKGSGAAIRLSGAHVSSNLLHVIGVAPILGRDLERTDELKHRGMEVIISHGTWTRLFANDPKVVGRKMHLNGADYEVIGVMPRGFSFPVSSTDIDLWTPLTLERDTTFEQNRGAHYLRGVGRMAPNATFAQAQSELKQIAAHLEAQYPASNRKLTAIAAGLHDENVKRSRLALIVLSGAVACLLLIACANVANLMLARATLRAKEVAVRTAIGASRTAILKQVLTESVVLAIVGGIAGLILAAWGTSALLAIAPNALPRVHEIGLDWHVLVFTAIVAIGTGLLFGIAPALQLGTSELNATLKEGGRSVTGSGSANRTRSTLVIAEVALSLVLLAGAGLLSATLLRLQRVNPGFDASNVLTVEVSLSEAKFKTDAQQIGFYQQLLEHIRAIPGVETAGAVSIIPLNGNNMVNGFRLENEAGGEGIPPAHAEAIDVASSDFFAAMSIPVKAGRVFDAQDDTTAPPVAVVNEAFAKKYWPGQNPLGKRFAPGFVNDSIRTVIGVVGDVRRTSLSEEPVPAFYLSSQQIAFSDLALTVRTRANAGSVAAAITREISAMDQEQAPGQVRPLANVLAESLSRQRFSASLLGIFAMIALALSAVGIFGVMSAMVTQRTRELAVRLALGAHPRKVLQLVLSHGASLAGIGIAIGLFGAFVLSRMVKGMLYDVGASDPVTLLSVSMLLGAVALLACYIPARRATRLDPIITLREE